MTTMRMHSGFKHAGAAALAGALALAWGLVSCSDGEVPIGDQDSKSDPEWDPADDPGAPRNLDVGPYGYCSPAVGDGLPMYVMQCPSVGGTDGSGGCRCFLGCAVDSDCPDPGSGTTTPRVRSLRS